jgi:leucine dehydrogenase
MKKGSASKKAKGIFEIMEKEGCRQITFHYCPKTKLNAILVIDSIPEMRDKRGKLGKTVFTDGGTRFFHKSEDDALKDALRLARAMTRKTNVLKAKPGGAKAVILARNKKTKEFLESVGDFIQVQEGFFKTAIDIGFDLKDAHVIHTKTDHIYSLDTHLDKGLGSTGGNTAYGIILGLNVSCKRFLGKELKQCSVAVQGLGAVGMNLALNLKKMGCSVVAFDIDKKLCNQAKKKGIRIVGKDSILYQKVDILAPCALGSVINKKNIKRLRCKIIAGGANNQLEDELADEKRLLKRGIVFLPDFVINAGGFLQALVEKRKGTVKQAREEAKIIPLQLRRAINYSKKNNCTLLEAAIKLFDR